MLNCTTRKQVEKVLPEFFKLWPTAHECSNANQRDMEVVISSLGFKTRRSERIIKLAKAYQLKNWTHVHELPGIGEYASRMWEMFFLDFLGDDQPSDGALTLYWRWRKSQ
jgi:methyl-CpG-binding domain protein 4